MKKKYDFKYDIVCIHNSSNQWYCKKCKHSHGRLYINNVNGLRYCPTCVPNEIKKQAIHINQNQELIEEN